MKSIAVYCGSSFGTDDAFRQSAVDLGTALQKRDITLVYGGAQVGLMGAIANAVLERQGKVIGVMPTFLGRDEIVHHHLTELIEVETMHERKQRMISLSDGFIAMPGGFGTMEELFEVLTWAQLGLHNKPIGLLNTNGYYDIFISFMKNMVQKGLLRQSNFDLIIVEVEAEGLLIKMLGQ